MYCWTTKHFISTILSSAAGLCTTVLLLASCSQPAPVAVDYYPVDSLVSAQIIYLTHAGARVNKVAMLDSAERKTVFQPKDAAGWVKELEVFQALQVLNKPINRGVYQVAEGPDSRSNLTVRSFTDTTGLPLEFVKVYYQDTAARLRKIEARVHESNAMYQGVRNLVMEFQEVNGQPVLVYYSVNGGQKMFLGDTVTYTVNAAVQLSN